MPGLVTVREPNAAIFKFRDDLVSRVDATGGRPGYTIEDPLRGKFFRLGPAEFEFLKLLNGRTSIAAALGRAAALGPHALTEQDALALCQWAKENQLAHPLGGEPPRQIERAAALHRRGRFIAAANLLCIRIPLVYPDRFFERTAKLCRPLFTWPAAAIWFLLLGHAIYLIATGWSNIEMSAAVVLDHGNWLRLFAGWALLKVLHETAHGAACKRYGGTVRSAGATLLFFMPLAYVDVTSSWRFTCKWQRMITAAAGVCADLFLAALATEVWAAASPGAAKTMALNLILTAGVSTLVFNANPLVRFDGYFLLSDWLEVPNLYACGQQWLAAFVQTRFLGRQSPPPAWPPHKGWIIGAYAVAAMLWRAVFFLSSALFLVGAAGPLGGALAALLLGFAWGLPAVQMIRLALQSAAGEAINARRAAASALAFAAITLVAVLLLSRPGRVTAPAVVEYAPLCILRAAAPGFVEKVLVADGDAVVAGQPIVVLRNDELAAELADLELAYGESLIKSRMLLQANETAKRQAEATDRAALQKKIAELRERAASLTVRAATAGRVHARNFDELRGRYLATGEEIAILGREEAKELRVAVRQEDVELFEHHLSDGNIHLRTASGERMEARLGNVEPRGGSDLPHPALSAAAGGPLAVKPVAHSAESEQRPEQKYELTEPVFQAKAALTASDARRLHAGQVVNVSFASDEENAATRLYRAAQAWMARLARAPRHAG